MGAIDITNADILVIGAGIAGLSLAARLSLNAKVLVLETESAPGYHASGRSVAFAHFGLGDKVVRTLTAMSMAQLASDPCDDRARYARPHPALHIARADQSGSLDALEQVHRDFGCDCERLLGEELKAILPALKTGPEYLHEALIDHSALKLDTDAMLQGHLRDLRARGGEILCGAKVGALRRADQTWLAETNAGHFCAQIVVNASGAWADHVAKMADARRVAIEPRRRTVIVFETSKDARDWPFVKTIGEGFYFLPGGSSQLLASPQDESVCQPCDAAPEEIDIATIAHRIEAVSDLKITRIAQAWAGLRSFAPDELPVIGFAPDAPGLFWFAGQGGYGFQTSPALAEIGAALVLGHEWPRRFEERGITPALFSPDRFDDAI